jgi:hypothetical protein
MSLYEGLSLLVSLVGTLFTIYLGLRQLRQAPPPTPGTPPPPSHGAPYGPTYGRARVPTAPVGVARTRPGSVTVASLFLYAAAAVQIIVLVSGWTYSLLDNTSEPLLDRFGPEAAIDLLGFGVIGVCCALLGLFVARGGRISAWLTWLLGVVGLLFFAFLALAALGFALDPTLEIEPDEVSALVFTSIYCSVLSILFITSASVLFNPAAWSFRKKLAG